MMKSWRTIDIGKYKVKIDEEDFNRINQYSWRVRVRKDSSKLSIVTSIRTKSSVRTLSLGVFLMDPPAGKVVYPRRYYEGLDYRKSNLIVCSVKERQQMLPKKRKDTSSQFRGVSYVRKTKIWRAGIVANDKSINLGDYATELEAARAYNRASRKYFGENGYQNLIDRKKKPRD
jgi:AP2-like factor, euAP2 lineage